MFATLTISLQATNRSVEMAMGSSNSLTPGQKYQAGKEASDRDARSALAGQAGWTTPCRMPTQ